MFRATRLACLLLTLALVGRVALPPGLMVDTRSGEARVVLCTGSGPVDAVLDLGKSGKKSAEKGDMPCTGTTPMQISAALPELAPPQGATPLRQIAHPALAPGRGLAAPPPPSTGPPRFLHAT